MPQSHTPPKLAYLTKRYPRFSETFVVNEILAHEAAGLTLDILALRPVAEAHFQGKLAAVRSAVTYVPEKPGKAAHLWAAMDELRRHSPEAWGRLAGLEVDDPDDLFQALWVARFIEARGITHLHAHFATVATTVARLAAALTGITYGFTAHAKDIYHAYPEDQQIAVKLRDAAYVVTVSAFNRHYLAETYGVAATKVRRIYNGLDLGALPFAAPMRRAPLILGVGRLIEKKGFEVLIDACARLAADGVDFSCRIIGDGERRDALATRIERLGLAGRVTLDGALPQDAVLRAMQEATALATPCVVGADGNRDGLPTVLLEAMAAGTPTVATPVTGIPELVRHDETGLLVAEHDTLGLAGQLQRLLGDGALRLRLARAARARIERDFDIHRNAAALRALFPAPAAALPELRRAS